MKHNKANVMKIGIIGSGQVGTKLAALATAAGHTVKNGDRSGQVNAREAAEFGEIVMLAIPYLAVAETVMPLQDFLKGKVVVDATNPLNADWSPYQVSPEGSGAEAIQGLLPASRVVKCFNTVFADRMTPEQLSPYGQPLTVLLCGDDGAAKQQVSACAAAMGFAPLDVGGLFFARYLESMAHLNIQLAVGMKGGTQGAYLYLRA